jgi:hypothetical protein
MASEEQEGMMTERWTEMTKGGQAQGGKSMGTGC